MKQEEKELVKLKKFYKENIEFTRLSIQARKKSNNDTTKQELLLENYQLTYKYLSSWKQK